jgi:hypothetical protein
LRETFARAIVRRFFFFCVSTLRRLRLLVALEFTL